MTERAILIAVRVISKSCFSARDIVKKVAVPADERRFRRLSPNAGVFLAAELCLSQSVQ